MRQIIIIGNGISGITCARNLRKKSTDNITIISAESEHFFSRTALMYIYMGHMKYEHTKPYEDWFWEKNNIKLLHKRVSEINPNNKQIILDDGEQINYDTLVVAAGSVTAMHNWPGKQLDGVHGLYSLQDLEKIESGSKNTKSAVIVGGGLIGVELAEMLHTRHISVTMLVKDKHYWGNTLPEQDAKLIEKQIWKYGITILSQTELKEIKGEGDKVTAILTKDGRVIPCEFVGITAGVTPNISFLKGSGIKTDKGVIINQYFETNIPDIYAIGDCAQFEQPLQGRKPIEQVWYTGRMHGETLALTLSGNRTPYRPGNWFNSAKFFDLEYQTYGLVPSKPGEGNAYFFWQHPQKDVAMGIYYNTTNNRLIGVNSYGLRLRHNFFDECLNKEKQVDFVLTHLNQAWFNPEFSKNYSPDILEEWNTTTGSKIAATKKRKFAFHL